MPPINTLEMERSHDAVSNECGKHLGQEHSELHHAELARGHDEIAVMDLSKPAHVARDPQIVRRVGEDHRGLIALHNCCVSRWLKGAAAVHAMPIQQPEIAEVADRETADVYRQHVCGIIFGTRLC